MTYERYIIYLSLRYRRLGLLLHSVLAKITCLSLSRNKPKCNLSIPMCYVYQ